MSAVLSGFPNECALTTAHVTATAARTASATASLNPIEFDKTDASGVVFAAQDGSPVSLD